MSETKGPQRLGKAATNLNVSKDTIIEFLKKKGVAVDNNPMAKIEAEVYDMLSAEFSTDQKAKEVVQAAATKLRESRESLSISDNKKRKDGESEEMSDIDLAKFKRPDAEVEKPKAKAKAAEAPVAAKEEKPVKEEVKVAVPTEEVKAPAEVPATAVKSEERNPNEVKVIGKIDLSSMEKPKRGKKAPEPKKEEPKKPKQAEPKVTAPVAKPEPAPETVVVKPEVVEKEIIRVNVEKLAGPKLMGTIILPTTPEKKSPAATAAENKEKRKRKRISKVDIGRQQEIDKKNANKPTRTPYVAQPKAAPTETDIQNQIKETLARLGVGGKSKSSKNRRDKRSQVARRSEQEAARMLEENAVLKLTEFVTVSELATLMSRNATEIIAACMQLGIFASINQRLDAETIAIVAEDFGYQVEFVGAEVTDAITEEADNEDDLQSRPPVITVMGHVDHGKTSLLDYIRKADVLSGEAGGITQHIGAYTVTLPNGKKITFLDTPGHEAFTAMRARGAQVTDLAIIVIAADDSVMPQTKEAISHAQAAGVPMIFAFNKMDKPDANAERLREQLSQMNILVEEWGGKFQTQEIAAKKGMNIDKLLEKVLLEAEMLDLKANPKKRAIGTIIESSLDKGRGFVATLLVEAGTLRVGDPILAGQFSGRVRAMFNERGGKVEEAGPATPVSILGFEGAPNAGDRFNVLADEREAREIATKRQQLQREQSVRTKKHLTIEEIGRRIALGDFKELNLIVKGDVDGSVEALVDSLQKLSTEKIQVSIIHKGVGQISESDVLLASASDAIIVGFQVRPSQSARKIAENEEIQIKLYSIIYKAIEEIKEAMLLLDNVVYSYANQMEHPGLKNHVIFWYKKLFEKYF